MSNSTNKILVFNPLPSGGITDYLHFQANAISQLGIETVLLTAESFEPRAETHYKLEPSLLSPAPGKPGLLRKMRHLRRICANFGRLRKYAETHQFNYVLLGAFAEYLSPFWARELNRLRKEGTTIGCIIHDPVRDFKVGPKWWHEFSIRSHYNTLDVAFTHHPTKLEMYGARNSPNVVVIPFPSYPFSAADPQFTNFRANLGIADDAVVLLSFGHIRDSKNIDLVLEAISQMDKVHLIQAGKEQSSGSKPATFYSQVAKSLGVEDRFHLINRFISESEISALFESSDFAVLTYSSTFHSGSAALGTCVNFKKPMLVSAAEGPLIDSVSRYNLGICVPPDSSSHITSGLRKLIAMDADPQWSKFEAENSWEANARAVVTAMGNLDDKTQ